MLWTESLVDVLLTLAVFEKFAPACRLPGAETINVKLSIAPDAIDACAISLTVLPDWENEKLSLPDVWVIETKVDPTGNKSLSTKFAAWGPLFLTVMKYVAFVPAGIELGPLVVTATSACGTDNVKE